MTLKTDLWVIVKESEVQAGHCNKLYNAVFCTDADATYFNTVNSIGEAMFKNPTINTLASLPSGQCLEKNNCLSTQIP